MNEAQERSLKIYRRDSLNECESCQGANGQHSTTCLAVVDQFYTYSCGACGKNSTIPKDGSVSPTHYTRCIRIGMPTYLGEFVDDFTAEDNS